MRRLPPFRWRRHPGRDNIPSCMSLTRRVAVSIVLPMLLVLGCGNGDAPGGSSIKSVQLEGAEAHCGTSVGPCRCNQYCQKTNCGLCRGAAAALAVEPPAQGATACADGLAGAYPCYNVDLLSFLPLSAIGGGMGNDIWGWTDPSTGHEYALMGRNSGTSIVDITDPAQPLYLGDLPTHSINSLWRDIKVYDHYALVVSEAPDHGMQVFDLTELRTVSNPPVTFSESAHYAGFSHAHNIVVDEDTGFAYAVGTSTCAGGPHVVDVHDPLQPVFAGCVAGDGYTHDAECVVYSGPDVIHAGQEICFSANEDTLTVVDVTDKQTPLQLSRTDYVGRGYTHQCWLTDDQHYLLLDDELDELNDDHNTRTYIWDVSNLAAPEVIGTYTSRNTAIDHNLYVRGGFAFEADYRSGLRILDLDRVAFGELREVAFFDIFPPDDEPQFSGAWSVYPFYPSGVAVVSGIEQGLYVVRPHLSADLPTATAPPSLTPTISATPTPTPTITLTPTVTQTFTPVPPGGDLAQGRPATQSSSGFGGSADRAVDGNTSGNWADSSLSHTLLDDQAWWEVDVGSVQPIASIEVWNRTDCCSDRLSDFWVLVSDDPIASADLSAARAQAGVSAYFTAGQGGTPTSISVNRTGRYVRVQLSGRNYLSLAEVRVIRAAAITPMSPTATATAAATGNLALGKPAAQSSMIEGAVPGRAVDGVTDGGWSSGSVTHTNLEDQPWWSVDLGAVEPIATIDVWNRTDCCADRLTSFWVLVSDTPFASPQLDTARGQAGVSGYFVAGTAATPTTVAVGRSGRYVRVQLAGRNYLSLAEVQVWRGDGTPGVPSPSPSPSPTPTPSPSPTPTPSPSPTPPPSTPDLARGQPAVQSSTGFGGTADRAADGETSGVWGFGSVSHTLLEAQPWWQVDLGTSQAIGSIEVWNRTDCCSARLSSFYVLVSDVPFASSDLAASLAQPGVSSYAVPGEGGTPTAIAVGHSGRYVRVQLSGTDYLSLAEVVVKP